jgi:hypothetical protein
MMFVNRFRATSSCEDVEVASRNTHRQAKGGPVRMAKDVVTPQRAGWLRTAPPLIDLPVLSGDLDIETAIIGGGYAGLNAAIRLS